MMRKIGHWQGFTVFMLCLGNTPVVDLPVSDASRKVHSAAHPSTTNVIDTSCAAADLCAIATTSHCIHPSAVCITGENWVSGFQIPWSKCRETLSESLEHGTAPSALDLRELVSHTMSDVFIHTRRASRDALRCIARKIVERQPSAFADVINGKVVADGVNSIMLMLESKKENLNRRVGPPKAAATSQVPKYGCTDHVVPDDESMQRLEEKRLVLCEIFQKDNLSTSSVTDQHMLVTYAYQRHHINQDMTIREVLSKWPFLRHSKYSLLHCKYLTGIDVEPLLRSGIHEKTGVVHKFLSSSKNILTKEVLQLMSATDKVNWPLYFVQMLMSYFQEDYQSLVHFHPVCRFDVFV